MRATNISNVGARCVSLSPLSKGAGLIPGSYAIPAVTLRAMAVYTNTMPTQAYRSSGRPEVTFAIERLIDTAADELGIDRVELRRRNLIRPDAMPYRNAVGMTYDSFGNIVNKGGATYTYGGGSGSCSGASPGTGVHAALSAGGVNYSYDCNGNNRTGDDRTIKYSVFDKPLRMEKGSTSVEFAYDPDRNFYKRTDNKNGQVTTTVTVGNMEKVSKPDGSFELRYKPVTITRFQPEARKY